jgi:hypothetical protein
MADTKKKPRSYQRDANGNLMCDQCDFKPKPTAKFAHGNPGTLHYHMKSKHDGDFAHVCPVCQHGFLHKITLDTHVTARHPDHEQKTVLKLFDCPVNGCDFQAFTKANRRIHFLRKHCHEIVMQNLIINQVENKRQFTCKCCQQNMKSSTSFHYHIAKCLVDNNVDVHPQLESIC